MVRSLGLRSVLCALLCAASAASLRADEPEIVLDPRAVQARASAALTLPTEVNFDQASLEDAMEYLKAYHGLPIRLDLAALKEAAISQETPITSKLNNIRFRRVLDTLLEPIKLDWYFDGEGLVVAPRAAI